MSRLPAPLGCDADMDRKQDDPTLSNERAAIENACVTLTFESRMTMLEMGTRGQEHNYLEVIEVTLYCQQAQYQERERERLTRCSFEGHCSITS